MTNQRYAHLQSSTPLIPKPANGPCTEPVQSKTHHPQWFWDWKQPLSTPSPRSSSINLDQGQMRYLWSHQDGVSKKQFLQWALALMDTRTKGPFFVRNSAAPRCAVTSAFRAFRESLWRPDCAPSDRNFIHLKINKFCGGVLTAAFYWFQRPRSWPSETQPNRISERTSPRTLLQSSWNTKTRVLRRLDVNPFRKVWTFAVEWE